MYKHKHLVCFCWQYFNLWPEPHHIHAHAQRLCVHAAKDERMMPPPSSSSSSYLWPHSQIRNGTQVCDRGARGLNYFPVPVTSVPVPFHNVASSALHPEQENGIMGIGPCSSVTHTAATIGASSPSSCLRKEEEKGEGEGEGERRRGSVSHMCAVHIAQEGDAVARKSDQLSLSSMSLSELNPPIAVCGTCSTPAAASANTTGTGANARASNSAVILEKCCPRCLAGEPVSHQPAPSV